MRFVALAAAVIAASATAGAALTETAQPGIVQARANAPDVYLLPLGQFPSGLLGELVRHIRAKLGLGVTVAAGFDLPPTALDSARKQYVADELLTRLLSIDTRSRSQTVVIGLTSADMYTRLKSWRYTFALRDAARHAVVSTARMDDRFYGLNPNEYLLRTRLEKMVIKQIGVLYGHLPLSSNRRSVLFDTILSVGDLDYMTEEFEPAPETAGKLLWLRRAGRACNAANRSARALVAAHPPQTPSDVLDLLAGVLPLEQRLTTQLAGLRRPRRDSDATARFLQAVQAATRLDEAALARLRAKWDLGYYRQWERQNVDLNFVASSLALVVGSKACGAAFYPAR